jgi:ferredoxin
MARIVFDAHHCAGHALCHAAAVEIYDLTKPATANHRLH